MTLPSLKMYAAKATGLLFRCFPIVPMQTGLCQSLCSIGARIFKPSYDWWTYNGALADSSCLNR